MVHIWTLLFWVITSILSTIRLTDLLHKEVGPYGILDKFRKSIGIVDFVDLSLEDQYEVMTSLGLDDDSDPEDFPLYDVRTFAGKLFDCIRCLSIWTATLHALVLYKAIKFPTVFIPILTFALSAIVVKNNED